MFHKARRIKEMAVAGGLMLFSNLVLAHPGHDHASWESPLIHALFYVSVVTIGVAALARLIKAKRNR
ncbi:MAG: hypothetical protein OIF57_14320 [Marinobacterium sp.]|nr:hypothetical protein [Marinobacterium sp.]